MNMNALEKCSGDRRKEGRLQKSHDAVWCMQTLRALLPRSNARLLPVLREDAEGSDGAWPESVAASSAGAAASDGSPEQQPAASREGSPVQALLSAIGVQIPTGDYQEGELSLSTIIITIMIIIILHAVPARGKVNRQTSCRERLPPWHVTCPTPPGTRQIQARPHQLWARCSVL